MCVNEEETEMFNEIPPSAPMRKRKRKRNNTKREKNRERAHTHTKVKTVNKQYAMRFAVNKCYQFRNNSLGITITFEMTPCIRVSIDCDSHPLEPAIRCML